MSAVTSPRWVGPCYQCHREREIETRYDHAALTLCDERASQPPRKPSAVELNHPAQTTSNGRRATADGHRNRPAAGATGDTANAQRLVDEHADQLRYVAQRRRWMTWDGYRWADDVTGDADRAAKRTVRDLLSQAACIEDDQARKSALKWALTSQNEPRIRAMLTLAATEAELVVSADDLDVDPYLLACPNGTIDLRTGKLRAPRLGDLITRATTVAYDPAATCGRWERTLAEVFAGDADLIAFVQRWVGYCLTGDTREHVLAVLHGAGGNGKTTIVETIKLLAGDLAATAPVRHVRPRPRRSRPTQ